MSEKKNWESQVENLRKTAAKYYHAVSMAPQFYEICERLEKIVGKYNVDIDIDLWGDNNPYMVKVIALAKFEHLREIKLALGTSRVIYKEYPSKTEVKVTKKFDLHPQVNVRFTSKFKLPKNGKCKIVEETRSYKSYSLVCG